MKLMQELMAAQPEEVVESVGKDPRGYARFQQVFDLMEKEFDHLDKVLKEGSQFRKLVVQLGGDDGFAKGALKALKELENEIFDLHMSVGIAQGDDGQGDEDHE